MTNLFSNFDIGLGVVAISTRQEKRFSQPVFNTNVNDPVVEHWVIFFIDQIVSF